MLMLQPQISFLAEWDKPLIALKFSVTIYFKPSKCACTFKIWWIIQAVKCLQTWWGSIKWKGRLWRPYVYQTPTKPQEIWTYHFILLQVHHWFLQDRTTISHLRENKGSAIRIFFFCILSPWWHWWMLTIAYRSHFLAIFASSRWTLETGRI